MKEKEQEQEKGTHRKFSLEFKKEAVELAKKQGNSKAAKELGVSESCIRYWRKKDDTPPSGGDLDNSGFKKNKSYNELEKENRRLEKENGYLREINKILKKSTAIFSADHMGGLK